MNTVDRTPHPANPEAEIIVTRCWRIVTRGGVDLGTFPAESAVDAMEALHNAAGYHGTAGAARALGVSVEALIEDLIVEPVSGIVESEL